MAHHNQRGPGINTGLEGKKILFFQLFQGGVGGSSAVMGVGGDAAQSGEMLEGAEDAGFLHARHHGAYQTGGFLGVGGKGAVTDGGAAGGHIGHGGKIEIESQGQQLIAQGLAHGVYLLGIVITGHIVQFRHTQATAAQTGDGAALLVHAQQQGRLGIGLGVRQERLDLVHILQVFGKVHDTAYGILLQGGFGGITGHGGRVHTGEILRRHHKQLIDLLLQRHGPDGLLGFGDKFRLGLRLGGGGGVAGVRIGIIGVIGGIVTGVVGDRVELGRNVGLAAAGQGHNDADGADEHTEAQQTHQKNSEAFSHGKYLVSIKIAPPFYRQKRKKTREDL